MKFHLVLAESIFEKQFSSKVGLHWRCQQILEFLNLQMFTSPGRNVCVGFPYVTDVTASKEQCLNYKGLWTLWDLISNWEKRCQFKCAKNKFNIGVFLTKLLNQFLLFIFSEFKKYPYERQFEISDIFFSLTWFCFFKQLMNFLIKCF